MRRKLLGGVASEDADIRTQRLFAVKTDCGIRSKHEEQQKLEVVHLEVVQLVQVSEKKELVFTGAVKM